MITFNLKKEWFEKIKSGEKTHEYREMTDYWIKRIHPTFVKGISKVENVDRYMCDYYKNIPAIKFTYGRCNFQNQDGIIFCCGYPKKSDKEKRLFAKIISVTSNVNGTYTDLKINKPVYDIEFELLKECENE